MHAPDLQALIFIPQSLFPNLIPRSHSRPFTALPFLHGHGVAKRIDDRTAHFSPLLAARSRVPLIDFQFDPHIPFI
jgi:hypothetical protein